MTGGPPVHSQLSLEVYAQWRAGDVEEELLSCYREVLAITGLKRAAAELGVDESVLSHAMSGRSRHPRRLDWLPWFVRNAPNDRILIVLGKLRGRGIVPLVELDPKEELERFKRAVLEEVGPTARKAIAEKVYGVGK